MGGSNLAASRLFGHKWEDCQELCQIVDECFGWAYKYVSLASLTEISRHPERTSSSVARTFEYTGGRYNIHCSLCTELGN